ncbi:MAG: sigma-54 interaction domain-containing protein, partial [Deltaproteobacteria bacterium]
EEYSQYWKTIVDTMTDGLMVVDSEGVIVSINQAMEEISGYSKGELIGKSCELLECDTCFKTRADGHDKYCALFKDGVVTRRKCTLRKKDGSRIHLYKNATILKDRSDRVIGGVETWTDLTEVVAKDRVISRLRKELSSEDAFHGILGKSAAMVQVFDLISSAAQSEAPVIIYGESGTGKELIASAIHKLGPRRKGSFIKVNCAALSESLLESELFGHVKGAFTGADRTRVGRFEAANGGDIFLDEIGDLPLSTQVKLLRVLQEKEIEKVGDHRPLSIDVRILAATNQDLSTLMEEGRFREDLYYRIGVIPIHLPPLRERREDVPLLIEAFINRIHLKADKPISGMSREALDLLFSYDWPGNVRELINVIEYSFVLCHEGEIMPNHLPARVTGKQPSMAPRRRAVKKQNDEAERKRILEALAATGGNQSKAAEILGISRVTLWKRLKAFDIQVDRKIRG